MRTIRPLLAVSLATLAAAAAACSSSWEAPSATTTASTTSTTTATGAAAGGAGGGAACGELGGVHAGVGTCNSAAYIFPKGACVKQDGCALSVFIRSGREYTGSLDGDTFDVKTDKIPSPSASPFFRA